MREITAAQIAETVARLCVEANRHLPPDVAEALRQARADEDWESAGGILDLLLQNPHPSCLLPSLKRRSTPALLSALSAAELPLWLLSSY